MATANVRITWERNGRTYSTVQGITVTDTLSSIAMTSPDKTEYSTGEIIDLTGATVTATYESGRTADVTSLCVFTPAAGTQLSDAGTVTITATYTEDGITKTAETSISVEEGLVLTSWAAGTDAQIKKMLEAHDNGEISIYDYWNIGDTRKVSLTKMNAVYVGEEQPAQDVYLVLVDKNVMDLKGGGKCHFVWQQKDALSNRGFLRSTNDNTNAWVQYERRQWCNEIYYNALPAVFRSLLKETAVKTATSTSNPSIATVYDKVFLPSAYSVGGEYNQASSDEDESQWIWYQTLANRIKKLGTNGVAETWWTRSPDINDTLDAYGVYVNRTGYLTANLGVGSANTKGIAPCGCI